MGLGVVMIDLTRLMFDNGASMPAIGDKRPPGDVTFMHNGIAYTATLHRTPDFCAGRTIVGWWIGREHEPMMPGASLSPEVLEQYWCGYHRPGWYEPRDMSGHESHWEHCYLVEFEPAHGVWPDGTRETY